ncbi:MAG: sirohydrochlorin chelatase [Terriglobia bacterium]
MTTGILLFAHGSPVEEANRGVRDLARKIEAAGPYRYVRAAFLDSAQPGLLTGVMEAAEAGLERLIVIPYFLTVGLHLRRDLPKLVAAAKEKHPNFEIAVGQSLEGHPLMPSLILGRVQEVLDESASR